MNVLRDMKVESKEVVFEPGNATRYHLVLTKINRDTMVVADLNNEKAIIIDPEFPSVGVYYRAFHKHGYNSSDGYAMAEFIVKSIKEVYYIKYTVRRNDGELDRYTVWSKTRDESDKWMDFIGDSNGNITERGYIWQDF